MITPVCNICGNQNTKLHYRNYPGYVEGTSYGIFSCTNCSTNFVKQDQLLSNIYDKIYSLDQVEGYEQYSEILKHIRNESYPLKYLSKISSAYYAVYDYVKSKANLRILEVGCGYGYLSYALNHSGFDATGLDISVEAITSAKENFGNKFVCDDFERYALECNEKYDLIIATEVIEHLAEPIGFVKNCLKVLTEDGKILLTTPSKDFFSYAAIWFTDLPPVHLFWFSQKSFKTIAKLLNVSVSFTSFRKFYPAKENRLIRYLRYRSEFIQKPVLNAEFKPLEGRKMIESRSRKLVKWFLFDFAPVRIICNFIYNHTLEKDMTLGVIISKN